MKKINVFVATTLLILQGCAFADASNSDHKVEESISIEVLLAEEYVEGFPIIIGIHFRSTLENSEYLSVDWDSWLLGNGQISDSPLRVHIAGQETSAILGRFKSLKGKCVGDCAAKRRLALGPGTEGWVFLDLHQLIGEPFAPDGPILTLKEGSWNISLEFMVGDPSVSYNREELAIRRPTEMELSFLDQLSFDPQLRGWFPRVVESSKELPPLALLERESEEIVECVLLIQDSLSSETNRLMAVETTTFDRPYSVLIETLQDETFLETKETGMNQPRSITAGFALSE